MPDARGAISINPASAGFFFWLCNAWLSEGTAPARRELKPPVESEDSCNGAAKVKARLGRGEYKDAVMFGELMEEKSCEFLEAECLKVARSCLGCGDLEAVQIRPREPRGSGPNWEVAEFDPDLPEMAKSEAMHAIDQLRGRYALASA